MGVFVILLWVLDFWGTDGDFLLADKVHINNAPLCWPLCEATGFVMFVRWVVLTINHPKSCFIYLKKKTLFGLQI